MKFKRIGAFLIDYLIITFISDGLVYITFINTKYEEYQAASETYANILTDYYDCKINADEFSKQNTEISYDLNKSGYVYIIGNIAISLLYYGVFVYFTIYFSSKVHVNCNMNIHLYVLNQYFLFQILAYH